MREEELELTLRESLPELPPEDVVTEVTPWGRAMGRILVGLALTSVTLNFLCLQYILPAIGTLLMLLGFRALRRENRAFAACRVLSALRAALMMAALWAGAAVDPTAGGISAAEPYLTGASLVLQLALLICFARALEEVKRKAGAPDAPGSVGWLVLWYVLVAALALLRLGGMVVSLLLLAGYFFLLRALFRLSEQIDAVGYVIEPAPVRLSDGALTRLLAGLLAAGIACGYLFFGQYPMDWTPVEAEREETAALREELRALGFPENVLRDLSAEELAACGGAQAVVTVTEDHPVNEGREVRTQLGMTTRVDRVYDTKELRITGVGVKLPGEPERWRIIHHFEWIADPGWFGTESIQLWPTSHTDFWTETGNVTGRLLMERGGATYCAPYRSLGRETYTADTIFRGQETRSDVFGTFSLPRNAERQRGYVAYTAEKRGAVDGIVDSWINYTHQRSPWQYPVRTAQEARMAGMGWSGSGVFTTVQDALQFIPAEDGAEPIR